MVLDKCKDQRNRSPWRIDEGNQTTEAHFIDWKVELFNRFCVVLISFVKSVVWTVIFREPEHSLTLLTKGKINLFEYVSPLIVNGNSFSFMLNMCAKVPDSLRSTL